MADPNKVWPRDKLGNEIREGKLIRLELPEAAGFFYVVTVSPATYLHGAEGRIPVNGDVECVLRFKMPYGPDGNMLMKAVVVEQPKQEDHPGLQ